MQNVIMWPRRKIRKFQERMLAWYQSHQRLLPWRGDPAPYRVWIAEVMLQQTRVQTALPYYSRFLNRFPTVETLAAASEGDVLEFWAGLGYYQRARNLRNAARRILKEMGGEFPEKLDQIRLLPGVGRYTAGAIYSIAYNRPEPVVDGNVRRVISRLHGIADAPDRFIWQQAESWLVKDQPSDFNQAVMELGALVCLPSRPLCSSCPVKSLCRTGRRGWRPPSLKTYRHARESVAMIMLVLECQGKIALARRQGARYIPGEWGLPLQILRGTRPPLPTAEKLAYRILGARAGLKECPAIGHSITHRRILARVYHARIEPPLPVPAAGGRVAWFPRAHLDRLLTSSLFRKGLATSGC